MHSDKVKFLEDLKRIENLKSLSDQFEITKSTIIFKINIVKLIHKYPKMMTSSITLSFLKSSY